MVTRPRVIVGVVVLALVGGGSYAWVHRDDPRNVRVDAAVARTAAKPIPETLPPPGRLEEQRRFTVRSDGPSPDGPQIVDGQLLVGTKDGIKAHDLQTGRRRWHYREPGRLVDTGPATRGALVVETDGKEKKNRFVGLSSTTGKVLWERVEYGWLTPGAASGVVAMARRDRALIGIDARTGEERWAVDTTGDDCGWGGDDRFRDQSLVLETCVGTEGDLLSVRAIDPATGAVLWRRSAADYAEVLRIRDGVTTIEMLGTAGPGSKLLVIDRTGRTLFNGLGWTFADQCEPARAGSRVVVHCWDEVKGKSRSRLAVMDLSTRKAKVYRLDADIGDLRAAGDQLYALARSGSQDALLPYYLAEIDLATGKVRQRPLPTAAEEPGSPGPVLTGVLGGRIYLWLWKGTLFTYGSTGKAREPIELGGVDPSDWPDPCALLAGIPGAPGSRAEPGARVRVGQAVLSRTRCSLRPAGGGKVTVDVRWVTATEREAYEIKRDWDMRARMPGAQPRDRRLVREGRIFADVRVQGDRHDWTAQVRKNLRRHLVHR